MANFVVGAVAGAGIDYAIQVAQNKLEGKDWSDALTEIDKKSLAISAGTGAAGVGLVSKLQKLNKLQKAGKLAKTFTNVAAEATVDGADSIARQVVNGGDVSLAQVGKDVVVGQVFNGVGSGVKKADVPNTKALDAPNSKQGLDEARDLLDSKPKVSEGAYTEISYKNADEVNLELKDRYFDPPPYTPGSKVVEYVPKGWEPEYGRIYDSKNPTNKASRFVTDLEYVKKNSISTIKKDMKVDAKKDAKAKVRIPEGTKMRIGEVNQGNGKQHEIVEFDKPQVKKILDWNQIND